MNRRKEGGGRREKRFSSTFPLLHSPFLLRESNNSQSTKLKLSCKSLISLTILLTIPVDKAVDKLWISCG
jgi:hypothetical protein